MGSYLSTEQLSSSDDDRIFSADDTYPFLLLNSNETLWDKLYTAHGTSKHNNNLTVYRPKTKRVGVQGVGITVPVRMGLYGDVEVLPNDYELTNKDKKAQATYFPVGDYIYLGREDLEKPPVVDDRRILFVKDVPGVTKLSTRLDLIWKDKSGSGGKNCSVWKPACDDPKYVALGLVWSGEMKGQDGHKPPLAGRLGYLEKDVRRYALVHRDYIYVNDNAEIKKGWQAGTSDTTIFGYNSNLFHTFWVSGKQGRTYSLNLPKIRAACCRNTKKGDAFLCRTRQMDSDVCNEANTEDCIASVFGTKGDYKSGVDRKACLDFAINNPSTAFDDIADKYCKANPNDSFCGCNKNGTVYKKLPKKTIADRQARAFPHCFIPDCTDGKAYRMKENRKPCDPITVCTQEMGASYDGSVIGNKMQQLCGKTYPPKTTTTPEDDLLLSNRPTSSTDDNYTDTPAFDNAFDPSSELPSSSDEIPSPALTGSGEVASSGSDEIPSPALTDSGEVASEPTIAENNVTLAKGNSLITILAFLLLLCGCGVVAYLYFSGRIAGVPAAVAVAVVVLFALGMSIV